MGMPSAILVLLGLPPVGRLTAHQVSSTTGMTLSAQTKALPLPWWQQLQACFHKTRVHLSLQLVLPKAFCEGKCSEVEWKASREEIQRGGTCQFAECSIIVHCPARTYWYACLRTVEDNSAICLCLLGPCQNLGSPIANLFAWIPNICIHATILFLRAILRETASRWLGRWLDYSLHIQPVPLACLSSKSTVSGVTRLPIRYWMQCNAMQ